MGALMISKWENRIARRRFLRGAGGVAIGLPFLLSQEGSARAQVGKPAERLITFYYGNGMPPDISAQGLVGPLAPLAPYADRMAVIRGVDCPIPSSGAGGHPIGSASFGTGFSYLRSDENKKSGPSIDWIASQAYGLDLARPVLSTGVYDGQAEHDRVRFVHSWRSAGVPNEPVVRTLNLFTDLFGGAALLPPGATADPNGALRDRYRRSVLDAVVKSYQTVMSGGGGYPASARRMIASHLETVRELEKVVIQQSMTNPNGGAMGCAKPGQPEDLNAIPLHLANDKAFGGDKIPNWEKVWDILLDLYVTAIRCNLVRFGNLVMTAGGERYFFNGGAAGTTNNAHLELFHQYPRRLDLAKALISWEMGMLVKFLSRMSDRTYKDVDGGSYLDNTTILVGTELGYPQKHSVRDQTFFLLGGRKRFKTGDILVAGRTDVDFYNTLLRGIGITTQMGDMKNFQAADLPILA